MPMTDERMLEEIMEISDKICSPGEIDFLDSCDTRLKAGRPLTDRMHDWLVAIYDRACKSRY